MAKNQEPTTKADLAEQMGLSPGSLNFLTRGWFTIPIVFLLVLVFLIPLLTTYIRPHELGVLRIKFGPNKGIQKNLYGPGLRFLWPGWEVMYRYPKGLQVLRWNKDYQRVRSHRGKRSIAPIRIQTSEGYNVQTDVTVLYRITNPYLVMTTIGPGSLYEDSALIPRSEKTLRLILGELNAEEFYRGPKRVAKAFEARERLNQDLKDKGLEILSVFIMEFSYDARYQRMIENRKLQDQRVFLQQAQKLATIQRYRKRVITEEGGALVREELARGDKEVARIESAAELYRRQRIAQGELLRKLAEAKGIELKNRALQGAGSRYMVALKMAEVFQGVQALVLPSNGPRGTNPLNLNSILQTIEVSGDDKSTPSFKLKPISKLKLPKMQPPDVEIPLPSAAEGRKVLLSPDLPAVITPPKSIPPKRVKAPIPSPSARTTPKTSQRIPPPARPQNHVMPASMPASR